MTASIRIRGAGVYTGETVWSIVRREYGRSKKLGIRRSKDRNSPEWGYVTWSDGGGTEIIDTIMEASGPMGVDNNGYSSGGCVRKGGRR